MKVFIGFFFLIFATPFLLAQQPEEPIDQLLELAKQKEANEDLKGAIAVLLPLVESREINQFQTSIEGEVLHKLGVWYYQTGQLDSALIFGTAASRLRAALANPGLRDLARSQFLLASIARERTMLAEAESMLQAAIHTQINLLNRDSTLKDALRLGYMYVEAVRLNYELGDFYTALSYLDKASRYFHDLFGEEQEDIADIYNWYGILYYELEDFAPSESYYRKAIDIYQRLGQNQWAEALAGVYTNLAITLMETARYGIAEGYLLRAKERYTLLLEESGYTYHEQLIGKVYANLTLLYGRSNQLKAMEAAFEKSREWANKSWPSKRNNGLVEAYQKRAEVANETGDYAAALFFSTQSLEALSGYLTANESGVVTANGVQDKLEWLKNLSTQQIAWYQQYLNDPARNSVPLYKANQVSLQLDTLITDIRQGYLTAASRYVLSNRVRSIYERGITIALELHRVTDKFQFLNQAYFFCARNKAIILLEGIKEEYAKQYAGIPNDLLQKEMTLRQEIFKLESRQISALTEAGKDSLKAIKDKIFALKARYTDLIDRFEKEYPTYYQEKYSYLKPLDIRSIQQNLSEDALLIEFFVGDKDLFVFAISKKNCLPFVQAKPENFESSCLFLRKASETESDRLQTEKFAKTSFHLYDILLKQPLDAMPKSKRLILVPDNILLQISFDPLFTEASSWKGKENPYLIKKYPISIAYSNRLIFDQPLRNKMDKAIKGFAGFGLEYDDFTLEGLNKLGKYPGDSLIQNRAAGRLVFSDDEVLEIAQLLSGDKWLNQAATKAAFLQNSADYRVLHLAMHGVVNEQNPNNSALIFSRTADTLDYLLRANELYSLQLRADLAVLSACHTGYGTLDKGEGMRSLARAFAYAGCPSLIASLWGASDHATKEILVDFYKHLQEGDTKDVALQKAKLAYLENAPPLYTSPSYWSHLSIIGDSSSLLLPQSNRHMAVLLGSGALIFLLLSFAFIRRRKMLHS